MGGLILKDFQILKKKSKISELLIQLILSILFAMQYGVNYLIPILVFLCSLTNINCFYVLNNEDEKVKWKQQLSAFPLTHKEVVFSRHLVIFLNSLLQLIFLMIISVFLLIFVNDISFISSMFISFVGSLFVFLTGILHISLKQILGTTASVISMILSMISFALLAYLWSQMNIDLYNISIINYIAMFISAITIATLVERLCYYFEVLFYKKESDS